MNNQLFYADPDGHYAFPESSPDAPGVIATLQQPIIGEAGFKPRFKPPAVGSPKTFTVTFESNIQLPADFVPFVRTCIVGVLGARRGDAGSDIVTATHQGVGASGTFYSYPGSPDDRLKRRLHTASLRLEWSSSSVFGATQGDTTVTFTLATGYDMIFARAALSALFVAP